MLPKLWKKSFTNGIITPAKTRPFNECQDGVLRRTCHKQTNKIEEMEANLNILKRQAPNEFGYKLPYFKK